MGDFRAGGTAIGLLVYFFLLFIILVNVGGAANHYNVTNTVRYEDTGFGNAIVNDDINSSVDSSSDEDNFGSVLSVLRFAVGFGNSVQFGVPAEYAWILQALIWIPAMFLLVCLYFMIPFFH